MFQHVVKREQAPHQHFRRRDPSAAVVSSATRLVDPATADRADPADAVDAGRLLLDGHALRDELADGATDLFVVAAEEARPLRTGDRAAVGTGERDPLGAASCPAKGRQRLGGGAEMRCPYFVPTPAALMLTIASSASDTELPSPADMPVEPVAFAHAAELEGVLPQGCFSCSPCGKKGHKHGNQPLPTGGRWAYHPHPRSPPVGHPERTARNGRGLPTTPRFVSSPSPLRGVGSFAARPTAGSSAEAA